MSSLPRKTQKIFGSGLTASGNIAVIGSTAALSPAYSLDLDTLQSLTAYLNGFAAQTVKNSDPVLQEFNALMLMITQQLAYILQSGVPEWDTNTTYWKGQWARIPGTGVSCQSLSDNNTGHNPATDTNNWTTSQSSPAAATMSGSQSVAVDGSLYQILYDTKYIDPNGCYSNTTKRYTAPATGDYLITAKLQVDNDTANAAQVEFAIACRIASSTVLLGDGVSVPSPAGARWYPKLAGMVTLNAGDVIEIVLSASDGGSGHHVTVSNSNWSIHRV